MKKKTDPQPPLDNILSELSKRRVELDALDTQISSLIRRVEEGLRKHFSTRIALDISNAHQVDKREYTFLAFGKHEGKWQLLLEEGDYAAPEHEQVIPLTSAPRETRANVFAWNKIEALVRNAVGELDKQLNERRLALETGAAIAQALDGAPF
ncbi:MAG: hypothetical protein KA201_03505 [Kofleriaceae bacterium]|nr:hypothetical protein [Kofleriaceae bacterium]